MALTNFTLPFGGGALPAQPWATISPLQQHATAVNNLLYGPAGHQATGSDDNSYYKNDPYAPPSHITAQQQQPYRIRNNNYLPPPPQQIPSQFNTQQTIHNQYPQTQTTRTYGENSYSNAPSHTSVEQQSIQQRQQQNGQYFNNFNNNRRNTYTQQPVTESVATPQPPITGNRNTPSIGNTGSANTAPKSIVTPSSDSDNSDSSAFPNQAPSFTRVQAGTGSRTQVHAVLDYDDDGGDEEEYYDEDDDAPGKYVYICYMLHKL